MTTSASPESTPDQWQSPGEPPAPGSPLAPAAEAPAAPGVQALAAPSPEGPAVPSAEVLSEPQPQATARAPRRKHPVLVRVAVITTVVALTGLSAYLVVVSKQWEERVGDLTAVSEDLGRQVASAQAQAKTDRAARDEAVTQLEELKARTTDLVNTEANAVDNQAILLNYLDAMTSCSQQRDQLIGSSSSDRWETGDGRILTTSQLNADLDSYCADLEASVATLKEELGQ